MGVTLSSFAPSRPELHDQSRTVAPQEDDQDSNYSASPNTHGGSGSANRPASASSAMAPRKGSKKAAVAPAAPPLDGCRIAFSGSFPGSSQAALQGQATSLSATTSASVTKDTTHLVTTQTDYDKPSAKVKAAKDLGIHIVSLQWLQDCLASSSREDEQGHAFGSSNNTINGTNGTTSSAAPPAGPSAAAPSAAKPPAKKGAVKANGSKKRQASPDPDADDAEEDQPEKKKKKFEEETHKEFGEGQIAKSRDVRIPLDEGCTLQNYGVYIDDDGVIWDASLNQTNAGNNNNKFYRIQLLGDGRGDHKTWTRWGRVGDRGQTAILGGGSLDDAKKQFRKKFKDKSGLQWEDRTAAPLRGKYTFIERSYNDDSDEEDGDDEKPAADNSQKDGQEPPKCTLAEPVQRLMELIFNQQYFAATMSNLNYDDKKLPLGKLSRATILKGFQTLKDLAALLDDNTLATQYDMSYPAAVEHLSNSFFSLIPHAFGRNRPPVINDERMVKQEIELLENLADLKDAAAIMKTDLASKQTIHPLDKQFQGLGMQEMTPLDPTGSEFKLLQEYLFNTRGHTHRANYTVDSIFRIERQGEFDRFSKSPFAGPVRDRRLLWHGSRATNFGGILSQGLRIAPPEAPVSGYMFGKGIYLADMSSKSANYCCSHITGGHALLLLCEAELGSPMQELVNAEYNAGEDAKKKGMWSTWGLGINGPKKWKDAGSVHPSLKGVKMPDTSVLPGPTNYHGAWLQYNEFITYDVAQVRLRYLFRVKM